MHPVPLREMKNKPLPLVIIHCKGTKREGGGNLFQTH